MSDLRTNNVRGYFAEFLVAQAVGAEQARVSGTRGMSRVPMEPGLRSSLRAISRLGRRQG
jgi:hypothetical protein